MMSKFKLKMVELYKGKDPEWKGWHNFCLDKNDEPHKAIAGPIDPETSQEIIASLSENKDSTEVLIDGVPVNMEYALVGQTPEIRDGRVYKINQTIFLRSQDLQEIIDAYEPASIEAKTPFLTVQVVECEST